MRLMTMSEFCLSELPCCASEIEGCDLSLAPLVLPWLCMKVMTMSESCLSELPCCANETEVYDLSLAPWVCHGCA